MNEQEQHWAGPSGDAYTDRNKGRGAANAAFFSRALARATGISSVIEFGAGAGENMIALRNLLPEAELTGVEINTRAFKLLQGRVDSAAQGSMLEFRTGDKRDLAFVKGVLIHIAPENIARAYEALYRASSRYVLAAEYYSPRREEVLYRGERGRLWKADFHGEITAQYPDLKLIDYGFVGRCDPMWPQDDVTWWLWEKR